MGTTRRHTWKRTTKEKPCPICRKWGWCAVTEDGKIGKCMHVEPGSYKTGTDGSGTYYLHRLTGDGLRPHIDIPRQGAPIDRANPDTLHTVYEALLCALGQAPTRSHREGLVKRGLAEAHIEKGMYRTLPRAGQSRIALVRQLAERWSAEQLLRVPGIATRTAKSGRKYLTLAGAAGLLVPVRDLHGRIVALKVRRDEAGDGPRYSYLSSVKDGGPGPESPVHAPHGIQGPCECVRITEGELKADVAWHLSGLPTLSAPGVANWRAALDAAKALDPRTIRLSFDADAAENPTVARALAGCADAVVAEGLALELERWDAAAGKGIDDVLAAGASTEVLAGEDALAAVRQLVAEVTAGEPAPPPDPLDRLDAVLADGGPAQLYCDGELLDRLAQLAETDPARYAGIRDRLRNAGIRMRELDAALAPLRQALRRERPPLMTAGAYRVSGGRIVRLVQTKDGPVEVDLCNFQTRIVTQTTYDDGAEKSIRLAVEGSLQDGTPLPRVEVPAEQLYRMEWVVPAWGTRAVVYAGRATAEHLRVALQLLSGDVPQRTVYGHLGWRRIGERWAYLHAGGAIGEAGPIADIEVSPPDALARFQLPAPPSGERRRRAVEASLALLELGPPQLAFPLLSAVYRAPLGHADLTPHLVGQTGLFKSERAALMQQHFGRELVRLNLPGSWTSTANALESIAFACKDCLLVVDDFAPQGGAADVNKLHATAERLLRAQGNASGRQRLRTDSSLRPARPPRGLILSTGEDVPRGQSLRARLLVLEIEAHKDEAARKQASAALGRHQHDAAEGLYAEAMAAYLCWLAPRLDDVRGRLKADLAELRGRAAGAGAGQHARTPGIVADLAVGLRCLLAFARDVGTIDAARQEQLWERGWQALCEAAAAQAAYVRAADPVEQFVRLLTAVLSSGRGHLAAPDGREPEAPGWWGWRREDGRTGPDWRPQGRCIGWLDAGEILLEPEAAYAAVQTLAHEQGEALATTQHTLRRRLHERGLLASTDDRRQELTIRRVLDGRRRKVLHLQRSLLPTEPAQPAHGEETPAENGRVAGRVAGRETANSPTDPPTDSPTFRGENRRVGGLGGLDSGRDRHAAGNNSPVAWRADGLTAEDTRTPFDGADGSGEGR